MPRSRRIALIAYAAIVTVAALSGCGGSQSASTVSADRASEGRPLPGTGKPPVTIGDKNFTEQFLLGELYDEALTSKGYAVTLNRDIGPTEVTMQALYSGRLSMYPEYLDTWDSSIAGINHQFRSRRATYLAARAYALAHGLELLEPTPFSDTGAIAVTVGYGSLHGLRTIGDLRKVAPSLTLGAPPQFQQSATGMPALEQIYGFVPAAFKPLAIGGQYTALDQGAVQAADVSTTDGELASGNYALLRDPHNVFGWGEAVPVVPQHVLQAEGPAFAATIDRVTALLSTPVMRQLNAAVDVYHQDPAVVAKHFLQAHGLVPLA